MPTWGLGPWHQALLGHLISGVPNQWKKKARSKAGLSFIP